MKKLLAGGLFLVLLSGLISAASGTFKITNKGPRKMYYTLDVGPMIPTGSRSAKILYPDQSDTMNLSALQLPTYVGIWEVKPIDLKVIPVQGGVSFKPQVTKIYTFKPGKSIDVYWTGEKLRPSGRFSRLEKRLFGTVQSIPFIPSR